MGENILQEQVKQFQKGRDRSLEQLAEPTLFERAEVVATIFTAQPTDDAPLRAGEVLQGHASADGKTVVLAQGHRSVGVVNGDGAKSLLAGLRAPGCSGMVQVEVTDVSSISGFFKVTLKESGNNQ
jgi:hypothetical protein